MTQKPQKKKPFTYSLKQGGFPQAAKLRSSRSLCEAQPARRLAEPDAARFVFQILQGVDFMHSRGYVHRDLKAALLGPRFFWGVGVLGWSFVMFVWSWKKRQKQDDDDDDDDDDD